ncbi:adenosine receptor A3-like isoform X1 [Montipora capricornis]|uniref:adenosine receptor A3-like isoform X1 n=2 Tax=Montipora capricornis TaxID=246305 RepID=UPI0035F1B558
MRMNLSSSRNEEQGWKPKTSNYEIILWCTAFSLTSIAILCANAIVITVFTVTRHLCKNGHILMFNLALADLLIGGIAMPLYICIFYKSVKGHPWHSRVVNEIYIGVDIFAGLSSLFILAVIASERVYSVFRPFNHRSTNRRRYWYAVALMWILAGCLTCLKPLASRRIIPASYDNDFILTFVSLSLVNIIVAYVLIWTKVYSRKKNCNVIVPEKAIVLAMLIVAIVFVIMWMPIYLLNVIIRFHNDTVFKVHPNIIYFAKLLQYCNSVANPIIYSIKIPTFRKALRTLGRKTSIKITRSTRSKNNDCL